MTGSSSVVQQLHELVMRTIRERAPVSPAGLIREVEARDRSLPDEAVRAAVWGAVNSGEAEMTQEGNLRIAAG